MRWSKTLSTLTVGVLAVALGACSDSDDEPIGGSGPVRPGWQVVVNEGANLAYDVPREWVPTAPAKIESPTLGYTLTAVAQATPYDCEGGTFSRGLVASTSVQPRDALSSAEMIARDVASVLFNSAGQSQIAVELPRPAQLGGTSGILIEATVTSPPSACLATTARLAVLVIDGFRIGGAATQVFVGTLDTTGGPQTTPPRPADELPKILQTVRQAKQTA